MEFINSAIKANQEIYSLLKKGLKEEYFATHQVGAGGDVSMGMDIIAEDIFIKHLLKYGMINSEEAGIVGSGKDEIIIDPIDGSGNFVSMFPYFGSSVALRQNGKVTVGVIANLANGDIFVKDKNAFLVAKLDNLKFKPVVTNRYPKAGIFERAYRVNSYERIFRKHKIKYRVAGAIALTLAYARYVDFIFFENILREYDIMAGLFMCEDLHIEKMNDFTLICNNQDRFKYLKEILKVKI